MFRVIKPALLALQLLAAGVCAAGTDDPLIDGRLDVWADLDRVVYVEAAGSPALTAAMRQAFSDQGFVLATERSHAQVSMILDGEFDAKRPATGRTAAISLGEFSERPDSLRTARSANGKAIEVLPDPAKAIQATIVSNLSAKIGVKDFFNSLLGDPDGFCLTKANCERWAYVQSARVRLERWAGVSLATDAVGVTSATTDAKLKPARLLGVSFAALWSAIGFSDVDARSMLSGTGLARED